MRSTDSSFAGFLILKVQVSIEGDKFTVEPMME